MRLSRFAIPAILSLLTIGLSTASHATTYVGGGGLINDVSVNTFDINVDENTLITNFNNVTFDGNHTFIGDLVFTLTHVNTGTSVIFINRVPSGAVLNGNYTFVTNLASQVDGPDSFWQAAFDSDASGGAFPIASGTYASASNNNPGGGGGEAITSGLSDDYAPTSLDVFNGENVNGTWRLTIDDQAGGDSGNLNSWSFAVNAAVVPEASSLALAIPALGLVGGLALRRRQKA